MAADDDSIHTRSPRSTTTVDLRDLRYPFVEACHSVGLRPSEVLRQLVARALSDGVLNSPTAPCCSEPRNETHRSKRPLLPTFRLRRGQEESERRRVELRLTASEYDAARSLARSEGMPLTLWITALVRSRAVGGSYLGAEELQALVDSSYQLQAVGRNLNQVARAVHAGSSPSARVHQTLFEHLQKRIEHHLQRIGAVIVVSERRWLIEEIDDPSSS